MMCSEKAANPVQTWLPGFSVAHYYTTFGMASSSLLYLCNYNVLIYPSTGIEKEVHRTEALKTSRSRKNPFFTASSYCTLSCAF